jgi:hypothetical protein
LSGDFASATNAIANWPAPPIAVIQQGERLCMHLDHGIGDGHILIEIIAAMTRAAPRRGFVDPPLRPNTRHPLFWSYVNMFTKPKRLLDGVRIVWSSLTRTRTSSDSTVFAATPMESPSVVVVRSGPNFISHLNAYRQRENITVSLASIVMVTISQALRSFGIEIRDDVEVVTDLRRYLPTNKVTLANFTTVVKVACGPEVTPQQFGNELVAKVDSAAPLLLATSFMVLLRLRSAWSRVNVFVRSTASRDMGFERVPAQAVVSFSDVTKLPLKKKCAFVRSDDIEFAVILPLGSPAHITVALTLLGRDEIHATATFYKSTADPSAVRKALQVALNPEGFQ